MEAPAQPHATEAGVRPWRFTVDDYERMAALRILPRNARVELIEGVVLEMSPIGLRHMGKVDRLNQLLWNRVGDRAIVRIHGSIRLDLHSEPQPDVVLLRPSPDYYETRATGPPDVLLLVEVMDSSVDFDRGVKLPLYARAGVGEVWLIDVNAEKAEVYLRPGERGYGECRILARGEVLSIEALPDVVVAVDEIFPPAAGA